MVGPLENRLVGQGRDHRKIGLITAGEQKCGFFALACRETCFDIPMRRMVSRDQPRGGGPRAEGFGIGLRRRDHGGMAGEPEIIVTRQIDEVPPPAADKTMRQRLGVFEFAQEVAFCAPEAIVLVRIGDCHARRPGNTALFPSCGKAATRPSRQSIVCHTWRSRDIVPLCPDRNAEKHRIRAVAGEPHDHQSGRDRRHPPQPE